jgi:hypothetical protein
MPIEPGQYLTATSSMWKLSAKESWHGFTTPISFVDGSSKGRLPLLGAAIFGVAGDEEGLDD